MQFAIALTDQVYDNPNSNTLQVRISTNDNAIPFLWESSVPLLSDDLYCQFCPDCNGVLTPQYFLEETSHCQPVETLPSGYNEPAQDWKCCNPDCLGKGEFSTRCNHCKPPKLLRWIRDPTIPQKEHWILHCPDCKLAGRRGRKKGRKGAMCGRCIHCKVQ